MSASIWCSAGVGPRPLADFYREPSTPYVCIEQALTLLVAPMKRKARKRWRAERAKGLNQCL